MGVRHAQQCLDFATTVRIYSHCGEIRRRSRLIAFGHSKSKFTVRGICSTFSEYEYYHGAGHVNRILYQRTDSKRQERVRHVAAFFSKSEMQDIFSRTRQNVWWSRVSSTVNAFHRLRLIVKAAVSMQGWFDNHSCDVWPAWGLGTSFSIHQRSTKYHDHDG